MAFLYLREFANFIVLNRNDPSDSYEKAGMLFAYFENTSIPAGRQVRFSFNGRTFSQRSAHVALEI